MSDSEQVEVGHVMKEPEFQDLENKNITKKRLVKWKETCVDSRVALG